MKRSAAVACLLLVAAWAVGCESTPLSAPSDGELRVTATPNTVRLDVANGVTEGQSIITAQVFDAAARPMKGVNVMFTQTDGTLASGGAPNTVLTDASGIATDTLTLTRDNDASVEVGATSGKLTGSATVALVIGAGNQQPTADLVISPAGSQSMGQTVVFDGRASTDPDGYITCYQYRIDSTVSANDETVQGPTLSTYSKIYSVEQTLLSVELLVSDDPDASSWCRSGGNPADRSKFSPNTDIVTGYTIVCDRSNPTVTIDNSDPTNLTASGGTVTLHGRATSNSALSDYIWDCGNGTTSGGVVPSSGLIPNTSCVYPANTATTSMTYVASLTVYSTCPNNQGSDQISILVAHP